jgi:hypothetical protein
MKKDLDGRRVGIDGNGDGKRGIDIGAYEAKPKGHHRHHGHRGHHHGGKNHGHKGGKHHHGGKNHHHHAQHHGGAYYLAARLD